MKTLELANRPYQRRIFLNLSREIDALENEMIRAAFRPGARRALPKMRAQLSKLTATRAAFVASIS